MGTASVENSLEGPKRLKIELPLSSTAENMSEGSEHTSVEELSSSLCSLQPYLQ